MWTNKLRHKMWSALSTIELLTVVGVLAVLVVVGYDIFRLSVITQARAQEYVLAEQLARDLIELTISKRNEDWNSVAPGQFYFAEDLLEGYVFTPGTETVNQFTRSITISTVNRDGSGNIVASGGTLDPDIYRVTARVEWVYNTTPYYVELTQYITNWRRF